MSEPAGGVLLVCATPIGNLGDVTLRVLDALRTADIIEAEDTRGFQSGPQPVEVWYLPDGS